MPRTDSAEALVDHLERAGLELSPEERAEIDLHQKGRALAQKVNFPGWQVALEMLQSYVLKATEVLVNMTPGDPAVPTAQAAASAASQIYSKFVQDVQAAISASEQTPEVLKRGYKRFVGAPPESL